MKKYFFAALILVILVLLVAWSWISSALSAQKYSVVHLSTNETYIGHLHTFPKIYLTDSYRLETVQQTGEEGQSNAVGRLVSLTDPDKSWGSEKIYLNRDQILFHGLLIEGTEADKAIKSKAK
jgi:uncharacterized alpha/beta hydrolase family protein